MTAELLILKSLNLNIEPEAVEDTPINGERNKTIAYRIKKNRRIEQLEKQ